MVNFGLQLMVLLSVVLLGSALFPIRRIHRMIPGGLLRRLWVGLAGLVVLSMLGALVFLGINGTEGPDHREDWLVALMVLGGSVFSVIVSHLSYLTAVDASRVASLEVAATIDPITELYNRRQIMILLERECFRAHRDQRPLSVLILDLDNFKRVNDTYGHPAGDVVLRSFGKLITETAPESSLVGRFGGEEFLVILPGMSSGEANEAAQRIRAMVEITTISCGGVPVVSPTVSIGVATTFGWKECAEDLTAIADEALYAAKTAGRNRVVHAFERTDKNRMTPLKVKLPTSGEGHRSESRGFLRVGR
jgi:diguanylate cyclase (GGDEF)-like protein